jgi:hypothetical protein
MTSTIVRASPAAAKTSVRNADARYRRRSTRQRDKTTRNERRRTFIFPRASGEGCFLLRSAMSNSDALFSKQASPFPPRGLRPGYFLRFRKNGLTRTGGVFICFPEQGKRSAERRIQFRLPRPMNGAQPRTFSSSPPPPAGKLGGGPLAFRRSAAAVTAGPRFLGLPGANGRTLPGASAASTSQSGHAPDGTLPKPPARQERRTPPAGTAPAPSVGVTGDVPHDEQDAALMQGERKPSRIIFLLWS